MPTPRRKHILIVEDDLFLRKACRDMLQRDGYEVVAVRDGEDALRKVKADLPDVVLLDWLLPTVPGLEVLRAVKADSRSRDVPVLVLSNSSREEDRDRALELGAAGYLIKADLSLHELRARIKKLLKAA
jgi:two-component system, OmpR family, phosphate regulon response regulator PhoB